MIVYDGRAVKALRAMGGQRADSGYAHYSAIWNDQFAKRKTEIEAAIKALPRARDFMRHEPNMTDQEMIELAAQEWFLERIFDTFLWEIGE